MSETISATELHHSMGHYCDELDALLADAGRIDRLDASSRLYSIGWACRNLCATLAAVERTPREQLEQS
ncbi:hypothetical protein FOS14_18100 [Skermania sp. ID1734]|uniref:hypothetical protein n=1 Tax=Skermania sp. ID1734 TaxID=2597516 RepID=UPI00117E0925|nr:hypothetical protein [Skermania sp. ID1734]TSD95278.1 hypothetical protein FOS14_18100 [Skermania sp. ID1734]